MKRNQFERQGKEDVAVGNTARTICDGGIVQSSPLIPSTKRSDMDGRGERYMRNKIDAIVHVINQKQSPVMSREEKSCTFFCFSREREVGQQRFSKVGLDLHAGAGCDMKTLIGSANHENLVDVA